MAGFTFNGFGASDTYRTLKELKTAHCNSCRKETTFALMELKMKIRLLYIPTVSIGTKYAVVCTRCKNGYYVDERQRQFILDNPASKVDFTSEGVILRDINAEQAEIEAPETVPALAAPVEEPPVAAVKQEELDTFFVKKDPEQEKKESVADLARVMSEAAQKKQSSAAVNVKPVTVPTYQRRKVCPSCRMMFAPEKEVCSICGSALQEK